MGNELGDGNGWVEKRLGGCGNAWRHRAGNVCDWRSKSNGEMDWVWLLL